jgi:hypothetical protein
MLGQYLAGYFFAQITGFLVGVLSSATLIFLLYYLVKPRLKISKAIAKIETDGAVWYAFKLVNRGLFFPVFDVQLELEYCKTTHVRDKANRSSHLLRLQRPRLLAIPHRDKKDPHLLHAVIVFTQEYDINAILLDPSAYLVLTVVARHGFSGTNQVLSQKFSHASIQRGMFEPGDHYGIIRPDE